ncbi:MAG TPA: glycoside hydrolase family 43 protein [Candidatus Limnocylindrales bacterium]|nr:glycoside hydrolase family 43 protein [Candidatus Limnocylindrales bacterium]
MSSATFTNPVAEGYFADPFVMRHGDRWYAYGTGREGGAAAAERGRVFEVRRSGDLVHWESLGHALETPDLPPPEQPGEHREYWAPELAWIDARLYLYYSTGIEDRGHVIRVAVADDPEGVFEDLGVELTPHERFAIDADPFQDDDGQRYLYYARDVLDGDRAGTSIAVDRLVSPTRLAGEPVAVLPPSADWQLYKRRRLIYGTVYDWHTLEGPFVRKRLGRYWMLFSGGAWTGDTYAVSWAVADSPLGPFTEPAAGREGDPAILLRTVPGLVGPGHCSVVEGPDGEDWLAYHAWDEGLEARRLCLDRIEWTPDGPRTAGPTVGPQPAPATPR